jgi:hypothetical protein
MLANLYWCLFENTSSCQCQRMEKNSGRASVPNPAGAYGMDPRSWAKAIMVATGSTRSAVSILWRKIRALIVTVNRARLISPGRIIRVCVSEAGDKEIMKKGHTHPKNYCDNIEFDGHGSIDTEVHRGYAVRVYVDPGYCRGKST